VTAQRRFTSGLARTAALSAAALFSLLMAFVVVEGMASVILFAYQLFHADIVPRAERLYTIYDPEIGWVSQSNVYVKDIYGPGTYLRTDAQGFRNNVDFTQSAPPGKIRVVCSGDSFTLGYGVDNDHTWCQLLGTLDDRIEPVNMGQGGYGIDQAFLWFRRAGAKLNPDVHLFALIDEDLVRMLHPSYLGYGKPLLTVRDHELVESNVPVPGRSAFTPWLTGILQAIHQLRAFQFGLAVRSRLGGGEHEENWKEGRPVALELLEELRRMADASNGLLVVVYLPTLLNCEGWREPYDEWWSDLKAEVVARGITVIDLTDECTNVRGDDLETMFIRRISAFGWRGAEGHYTAKGNDFIARRLYERLAQIPAVAERLAQKDAAHASAATVALPPQIPAP
jgi:hypothetical protein